MKKVLLSFILFCTSLAATAQTATDFTANDCNGTSHNLFSELNAGKVIVLCWVMPCGACTAPALTTYNVVQSYLSSNPNTVFMYLCDDYANTSCNSLNSWANTTGLTNAMRFSNASINMLNYGSSGMPKIVVIGGANHTVFYNVNNTVNSAALQTAINSALSATGTGEPSANINVLNVYPNPAENNTGIKLNLVKDSEVALELFNLEGMLVQNIYKGRLKAGESILKLNLAKIAAGIYLIKFADGKQTQYINLVKE